MSVLFYKRPDYIEKEEGQLDLSSCQKYVDRAACSKAAIPESLSFDKIMEGKTLPPCSVNDFLDYLIYVSHDAENLQFYLWLEDYTKRFNALPESEKSLSPEWKPKDDTHLTLNLISGPKLGKTLKSLGIREFGSVSGENNGPAPDVDMWDTETITATYNTAEENKVIVDETYTNAGFKWKSFDVQPFRDEISMIIAHYISPNSARELNLSHQTRTSLLHSLQHTTHPSAFAHVREIIGMTLRNHSHPNFVRWSICNGNKPRVFFLRSFAVFWLTMGFVLAILLILSSQSRWWRIWCLPVWWFSITNLVAAYKGLCVLLFRQNTRELHPWEMTPETASKFSLFGRPNKSERINLSKSTTLTNNNTEIQNPFDTDVESLAAPPSRLTFDEKLDPVGPANSRILLNDGWIARWHSHPKWRKLALKKVWVQEEGLRLIQNRIVMQAELWAVLISVPLTVATVACPVVGLY